ncbi:TPA: hypothetical protein H1005_03660 [archaeon]|nr:hypothetical protein [Candidatus Naiadarchaeales archaeon SRR2090153.bin1042]
MDFFAHIFWTAIIFRNQSPLWIPLLFVSIPDSTSWGVWFVQIIVTGKFRKTFKNFRKRPPDFSKLPKWVWTLYGASHSIFSFAVVFGTLSLITGKIFIPVLAWLVHILLDLPTHSREFLGTPFLWPLSDWKFPGFTWGKLWFILLNWGAIIFFIIYLFGIRGETLILF